MKDFVFKIRHYGIKRMLPKIVVKDVYVDNVVCENPYTTYYQLKKEGYISFPFIKENIKTFICYYSQNGILWSHPIIYEENKLNRN